MKMRIGVLEFLFTTILVPTFSKNIGIKKYHDFVLTSQPPKPEQEYLDMKSITENEDDGDFKTWNSLMPVKKQYVQIAITKSVFYYTPLIILKAVTTTQDPSYLSYQGDQIGREEIVLREEPKFSPFPGKTKYIWLQKQTFQQRHRDDFDLKKPGYFVYDVLNSIYGTLDNSEDELGITFTRVILIHEKFQTRIKRSRKSDKMRGVLKQRGSGKKEKKIIHIPTLYIEPENDGFQNIFYEEMINAGLCLTSQPEVDRHELVDEYEVLLCNKKGYGKILSVTNEKRSKRESDGDESTRVSRPEQSDDYHEQDTEGSKWHMNKTHYDTLWKAEQNSTTTRRPSEAEGSESESIDYDYENTDPDAVNRTGWENDDMVEDPSHLNYMTWPTFLPDGITDDDDIRRNIHSHKENFTMEYIKGNLLMNQMEVPFEKRLFALNESTYLANYYEYIFKLSPYNIKPLLINFFDKRQLTLNKFKKNKLTPDVLRQLLILFTVDVHHVNCFNRHIRFYGYIMKKPGSINGDEITNDARLARGIIMRSLELIRHVPQYNARKEYFLRFLIAALRERASLSKSLATLIGENDYTELYEVASYLVNLLKNGIHPDEMNQDLFVQETRFYSHHFMNTLTL